MNNPDQNDRMLKAVRGELMGTDAAEWEQKLKSDAQLEAAFEEELALNRALEALPDAPVSSNFTSLVLQEALREPQITRRDWFPWLRWRFARVAAGLALVTFVGLFANQRYQTEKAEQMARGATAMAEVATVIAQNESSPAAIFEDFEAIQTLGHLPADSDVDVELLVALQR